MNAETIKQLDAIKEGTRVTVAYTQHKHLSVCRVTGRWVQRDLLSCGYQVMGTNGNSAVILLTDKVAVTKTGRKIHIRVDLLGQRINKNELTEDVRTIINEEVQP